MAVTRLKDAAPRRRLRAPARPRLAGLAALAPAVLAVLGAAASLAPATARGVPIYRNRADSFAERAADLVARMTLAEKASQTITSSSPAIPRLGVAAYGWWNESLHGVARLQLQPSGTTSMVYNTTSYPSDLALGSTWDPTLAYAEGSAISDEARDVVPGHDLDLTFFAPTVNLTTDPRWGRNEETYSEDPLLTAAMASQYVDGLQGQDPQGRLLPQAGGYLKAIATVKHYPADDSEVNRITGSWAIDERTLREYYAAPFEQIIREAHPGSLLSAFREINGTPSPVSIHLNDTLARETFGFGGYLTSDCDALYYMVAGHHWTPPGWSRPADDTEARALAAAAGEDLNCNPNPEHLDDRNLLPAAVGEGISGPSGTFTVNALDTSLVRLFTARMRLGEFDDPAREPWVRAARARFGPGSFADTETNGAPTETPSRLALARAIAERSFVLLRNAPVQRRDGTTGALLPLQVPRSGPFKVAVIGAVANPGAMYLGGYSSGQYGQGLANEVTPYQGIRAAIQQLNPSAQVDFINGFTESGQAAQLTTVDPAAVTAAAGYDAVIVDAGTDASTAREGHDRTSLALPGAQAQLIQSVEAANPNTIVVLQTLGQVDLSSLGNVPALLWSSFTGQRTGDALAAVLLGQYDPSGHLPFTWYASAGELAPITDYRIRPGPGNPGRTYEYFRGPVSYPFGYGLSYTTFRTRALHLSTGHPSPDGSLHVSVQVTNTGQLAGSDLVQLYVQSPGAPASTARPMRRLAGFTQVVLTPGQTQTVTLTVRVPDLAYYTASLERLTLDRGTYWAIVSASTSAADTLQQAPFSVTGRLSPELRSLTAAPTMAGDAARGITARVIFPERATVAPNLTLAMNDDTLYGHIAGARDRPLPAGATVRLSSDHPTVVAVGRDGSLRTLANGVATITATVRQGGRTVSTQFVVRVVSELSALGTRTVTVTTVTPPAKPHAKKRSRPVTRRTVTLASLPAFAPDTKSYEVTVPAGAAAPQVYAANPDPHARMRIQQARTVPGTAQVQLTGPDGIVTVYRVFFAHPPQSDPLAGPALAPAWSWLRPVAGAAALTGGQLVLAAQPGAFEGRLNSERNVLLQPALGNWSMRVRLAFSAPPAQATEQAGLVVFQDTADFLKLDWEYAGGQPRFVVTTEDSLSGAPVTQTLLSEPTAATMSPTVWLRIDRRGPRYATYYSTDGVRWAPLIGLEASLQGIRVGLFALTGAAGPASALKVGVSRFTITPQQ